MKDPKDDLTTALVTAEVDGETLTPAELASFFILLVVAGNETTRNAISHGLLALTEHPEQKARWMADFDAMAPAAVEEIVRWATPVIHFRRTVTQDGARIGDQTFNEGDKVVLWYCSANRDDGVFDDPFRFDIGRTPNDHLGFGGPGPHFCLGAHLARREITVMFKELFRRMPDIRAVSEPERLQSNFINGIKHLQAEWTPAVRRLIRSPTLRRCVGTLALLLAGALVLLAISAAAGDEGEEERQPSATGDVESPSEVLGDADEGIPGVQAVRVFYKAPVHATGEIDYGLTPPAGGLHAPIPWNCGFYDEPVIDENVGHSLEHGAVWLAYSPDLPPDGVERIHELARQNPKVLAAPYEGLRRGRAVVATAWARQLRLDSVIDPRLAQFVEQYQDSDQAPEREARARARRSVSRSSRAQSATAVAHPSSSVGVAEDLEAIVDRHAVPAPEQQVARGAAQRHVALGVAVLEGDAIRSRGSPATRRRCRWRGGGWCRAAAASRPASARRRARGARRCRRPRASGSMAPPAASQRWTAVSWAMRRG